MYSHPQNRNVIIVLLISFVLPDIIRIMISLLVKNKQMNRQTMMCCSISDSLIKCACCIIIGYLYREMLKADLKKTFDQKKKLLFFMAFALLIGGLRPFQNSAENFRKKLVSNTK